MHDFGISQELMFDLAAGRNAEDIARASHRGASVRSAQTDRQRMTQSFARACLATGASAVAVLALAAPAVALSPTVQEQHVVRSLVAGECDGDLIVADFDFMRTFTTFYDNDGVVVRQVIHAQISGTVRDTVTGATLPAIGVRNIILDGTGRLVRSTGTNVHVVVPGLGTVQLGAGNFGFDDQGNYFAHGRLDPPITAQLCEALAN